MNETTAYKVLTADQMLALEHEGSFAGAPVDLADGYIHLSTAEQLGETLARHFAGQVWWSSRCECSPISNISFFS